ncbi:MAG: LysR substrate-binding domain-containing protein [Gammaproteobacteria bacterium]
MNLRTLGYLVALEETRHFGRAAERCFVSQPTLSAQLKKLEEELGVSLVERRHKNVLLTEVGHSVVTRASTMLRLADDIKHVARHHQSPLGGRLSLGFIPTLGPYLLPHIVDGLTDELPDMQFYFAEHQTADLVPRLAAGDLDVAFLAIPHGQNEPAPLETRVLFDERFVVAMPAQHSLVTRKRVPVDLLEPQELLLLQDGHCLRDQALDVCGIGDSVADQTLAATSLETLRQMVAAGQGITLLPELAAQGNIPSRVAVRYLSRPEPKRQIAAMWRQSSVRTEAIGRVCDLVSTQIKSQLQRR